MVPKKAEKNINGYKSYFTSFFNFFSVCKWFVIVIVNNENVLLHVSSCSSSFMFNSRLFAFHVFVIIHRRMTHFFLHQSTSWISIVKSLEATKKMHWWYKGESEQKWWIHTKHWASRAIMNNSRSCETRTFHFIGAKCTNCSISISNELFFPTESFMDWDPFHFFWPFFVQIWPAKAIIRVIYSYVFLRF